MPVDQVPPGGFPGPRADPGPNPHENELAELSALVMGRLSEDQAGPVREHLADCEICLGELPLLEETAELLASLESEPFLEGPPEDADLLVHRAMHAIRAEDVETAQSDGDGGDGETPVDPFTARARERSRSPWMAAAAAAAILVAVGAGALGGRLTGDDTGTPIAEPSIGPAPAATPVPGTRIATRTDPGTGARLSVQVVPAAGWVRVTAATSGIGAGEKCHLLVVTRDGARIEAGSWAVTTEGALQGTTMQGSAIVDPAAVAAVQIRNDTGKVLVSTPV